MVGIKDFEMPYNCYDCDLHNYHECDLTGESIEEDYCWNGDSREKHCPLREVEAIPKADYETRLKADLEAILVEIKLEIEEMSSLCTEIHGDEWNEINTVHSQDVLSLIQEKINSLRENTNADTNN